MKKITPFLHRFVAIWIFIIFCFGMILAFNTFKWSRQAIYQEHDKHLLELANVVDTNISIMFDKCRSELNELISDKAFQELETQINNDQSILKNSLSRCSLLFAPYSDRILVKNRDTIVFSTVEDDRLQYSFLPRINGNDISLCINNITSKSYLAISVPSQMNNNIYYILIDLEPFFKRVITDTVYEDHWVVLYDIKSGLILHNDHNRVDYAVFSSSEILERDDGYTKIHTSQITDREQVYTYSFSDEQGKQNDARIYVIPTSRSVNKVFTIGVATYNERILAPVKKVTLVNIFSIIFLSIGAMAGILLLLNHSKKERKLTDELALLEKEKQLSDELLKNQEQSIHRQKLETIGTLTAGIAHEFNNMLSPIMGNSMLILEKSRTTDEEIFSNALEIYKASDKAKELVQNICKLSRKQSLTRMNPLLPDHLISKVLSMSIASIPNNIVVVKVIKTDCKILGDEAQLEHMLLNLIINAIHSMTPEGGTLTICVSSDSLNVYISISDTGTGIPPENMDLIFDPFFTTKEAGKGTGLGLPIAQQTAENHDGSLTAENNPEGGARFTFTTHIFKQD